MAASTTLPLDVSVKRRSLPPLKTSENDLPTNTTRSQKKKPKKKRSPVEDVLGSQPSISVKQRPLTPDVHTSRTTGSRENLTQDGSRDTKKPRKKKAVNGHDLGSGTDDGARTIGTPHTNNLKSSPVSARRKKDHRPQSRIQRSISDEVLVDNEMPVSVVKRNTKRHQSKHYADDSADDEADGVTSKCHDLPPAPSKVKKKQKAKSAVKSVDDNYQAEGDVGMSLDFMIAPEDIVSDKQTNVERQPQSSHAGVLQSQPIHKLFTERKTGFKGEDKARLARQREQEQRNQQPHVEAQVTSTQVALTTHRASLTFALFFHGLLAGFAMWHCVTVYMLETTVPSSDLSGQVQFLEHYSRSALPAGAIYYFLLAICTVSVFDRFDIGRPDKHFFHGLITFQSGAISILVYIISLILSVSIAAIDDRIGLFFITTPPYCGDSCPESGSLWGTAEADTQLNIWKVVNVIRAIGACLGWLVIAITPTTDFTSDHLHDAEEPLWNEQEDVELNNYNVNA